MVIAQQEVSDASLQKLQQRDKSELTRLVHKHSGPLYRAALGLGFQRDDARELVQQCWLTFVEVAPRFEGRSKVRTFLFGILYKKACEARRKLKKHSRHEIIEWDSSMDQHFAADGSWQQPPIDPEKFLVASQTADIVRECLEGLSVTQRLAFMLREISHQSRTKVCNVLKVSDTHLRVLIHRARNQLRNCIEQKS